MTRMRAMDAAFLTMERPAEPRHLGSVTIFGPGRGGRLTYDQVRALLEERLPLIVSAQRVVVEVPFGLARPSWGPAEGFDLEFHLRHTGLAPPGDAAALGRLIARLHAVPLDRSRPLWELWVIDGLRDDRVALYAKIHMAAVDGVTGAEVMTALLDPDRAGKRHVQPHPPIERPHAVGRVLDVDQLRQVARFPGRMASRARHSIEEQLASFGDTLVETVQRTPGLGPLARLIPRPANGDDASLRAGPRAPRVSWNAPVTPHRRVAITRLPLERILAIKRAAGTTVNDVVIAVCAGALRDWLAAHDELPSSPIVALVPMLVGGDDADDAHVAGLTVPLPTTTAAPADRLARTSDALTMAKQRMVPVPASLMQDISLFAPPALGALAARVVGALPHRPMVSPTVNVAITNVPGSRQQMYLAGHPLEASHPVLTINDLSPLHIGLQSSHDAIDVGAVACRDTLQDLDQLVARMPVELDLLEQAVLGAGGTTSATKRRRKRS
jgi:diacylglycerol O-acyltransferase / wax synthase